MLFLIAGKIGREHKLLLSRFPTDSAIYVDESTTAEGITISGGEPFDQPDALFALLARIRSQTEADILVFTGYPWAAISGMLLSSPASIDALVTGPFDINERQTLALRGSDNQELHLITDKGRARFAGFERLATEQDRAVDVMFDDNGDVWFTARSSRNLGASQSHMPTAQRSI